MARSMWDTSELDAYADMLRAVAEDALDQGARIIKKGAVNVKNDARRMAPVTPHAPYYASSIAFDEDRR